MLEVIINFPFNFFLGSLKEKLSFFSLEGKKDSFSSNPDSLEKETFSFINDFLYSTEYNLLTFFQSYFFSCLEYDIQLYHSFISFYVKSVLQKNEDFSLALSESLLHCLIKTLVWKNEKSLGFLKNNDAGVYVLYNKESCFSYIGQTYNIEKRFSEHFEALSSGVHSNRNLRKAVSNENIKNLVFLIIDYGYPFNQKGYRLKKEIELINTWPGPLYNIKDYFPKKK